jgi:hypothetical protein
MSLHRRKHAKKKSGIYLLDQFYWRFHYNPSSVTQRGLPLFGSNHAFDYFNYRLFTKESGLPAIYCNASSCSNTRLQYCHEIGIPSKQVLILRVHIRLSCRRKNETCHYLIFLRVITKVPMGGTNGETLQRNHFYNNADLVKQISNKCRWLPINKPSEAQL